MKNAFRLWLDQRTSCIHEYMALRRVFTLEKQADDALFQIQADSDFIAWLDGKEIGRGQYSDDPRFPTYTNIPIGRLVSGKHLLALSIYHQGRNCSTYTEGLPGTRFLLKAGGNEVLVSDTNCKAIRTPGFRYGEMPVLTPQMGMTMEYDGRQDSSDWRLPEYDDSTWPAPFAFRDERQVKPRPNAARPILEPFVPGKLVKSGLLRRNAERETVAMTMAGDCIFWDHEPQNPALLTRIPKISSGWSLIYDLGEEKVGFVEFELDAPAGTIVDFAHGEHLDDGHVRMECFGRNFADRYICRGSHDRFQLPFRRIGGRYLEFHLLPPKECDSISFKCAGVAPWRLPLPKPARFSAKDKQLGTVRKLAIRTLELCMHEHYEDCPWREQAMYAYDSRNQMLYGYYAWGNYDFVAASLNLMGHGMREDGFLYLCHPARKPRTIPMFSTIWPLAVYEHRLFSGDSSVWNANKQCIRTMAEKLTATREPKTGLYQALDPTHWHFYEWTPGLDHIETDKRDVHALYNLYIANMLEAIGRLEQWDGDESEANRLLAEARRIRQAVDEFFYLKREGCYASFLRDGKPIGGLHEHVQLMMLYSGAVPNNRQAKVVSRLISNESGLIPVTLSPMPYLVQAMLKYDYGAESRRFLRRKLEENYYPMLDGHSTTLWETAKGGDDFTYAGSLCHGWSSLPLLYCGAGLLGITPLDPGFRRFRVKIWSDGRDQASGEVPTPSGPIKVRWEKDSRGRLTLDIYYHHNQKLVLEEFPESKLGTVTEYIE